MEQWLPIFFAGVMGVALLIYIILDGYDLGIGLLIPFADDHEKDVMIASIGPFWDANETWIVLGVGVLLIAFPKAHGVILTSLYIPVTIMLLGLILRGVAFDFRAKVELTKVGLWNRIFFLGSLITSMAQGWMLGSYVMGLKDSNTSLIFSILISISLPSLYIMLGCGWLFVKVEGALYTKTIRWAKIALIPTGLGLFLISIATPIVSDSIANKWFSLPQAIGLLPIPISSLIAFLGILWLLNNNDVMKAGYGWIVFVGMIVICIMSALGLAYSIYPDIVIDQLTIEETASSTASLQFTFWGVIIVVPMIIIYTFFIYRIFSGKVKKLSYE